MIYISDLAQKHFEKLLKKKKKGTQIQIFIINPGTENAECGVSYCKDFSKKPSYYEIKFSKFSVFIDKKSIPYLKEAEIDFVKNNFNSELTLKAPHAKSYNRPKFKSLIEKVNYFIEVNINPYLESHGGYVTIKEIDKKNYAILEFSGGCNGCSMASITLKEGIEKKLLEKFSELKGIKDITEHQHGEHSYL